MLNSKTINACIDTLGFELELSDNATRFNSNNPHTLTNWIKKIQEDYRDEIADNLVAKDAINQLQSLLNEQQDLSVGVTKDELNQVYEMLKNRELHPAGEFDKRGFFYLEDYELVDVRAPSVKYPYSQMKAGKTSKFVKALAQKYKPQNFDDLISLFRKHK